MKNPLNPILLTIWATIILFSCNKSNTPALKDYSASVKDKTWWGELTYIGKHSEYYCVHFNADKTIIWSQFSGDYTGHWVLSGKQLTITFDGSATEIKADISDDNNLSNLTDNNSASEINNGQLITNSTTILDNTIWSGNTYFPATKLLQLTFMPGLQVSFNLENSPVKKYTYTKSSLSPVIRIGVNFFGIITSAGKMKGSVDDAGYTWQVTKQ